MRRLAVLLLILSLASPATAQQRRIQSAEPTAAEAGLRGAEGGAASPPPASQAYTPPAGLAFTRPLDSTSAFGPRGRTPSQCRTACAQSYYFCLADEDEQSCNPRWARCSAGCA
jgi:hypothetical protein